MIGIFSEGSSRSWETWLAEFGNLVGKDNWACSIQYAIVYFPLFPFSTGILIAPVTCVPQFTVPLFYLPYEIKFQSSRSGSIVTQVKRIDYLVGYNWFFMQIYSELWLESQKQWEWAQEETPSIGYWISSFYPYHMCVCSFPHPWLQASIILPKYPIILNHPYFPILGRFSWNCSSSKQNK